jgi:aspartyl-tRNA(Asn)/glutamyl-tRNA(Gln) amidotransferase subunit B
VAVERLGLAQVSDSSQIERWIDEVIEQSPAQVAQYRAGKVQIVGFLVGQVMKRSGGRAEPKSVQQLMRQALDREPVAGPAE